jgi:hypothetical protein
MMDARAARSDAYPWYDSQWLAEFSRWQARLAWENPDVLARFVEALRIFRTRQDYQTTLVRPAFADEELGEIRRHVAAVQAADLELHEAQAFGRLVVHNHPAFTELHGRLVPLVSEIAGEDVEPSYTFLSLYGAMGACPPHLDAPEAKWTLDLCVNQSAPWPLYVSQVVPWPLDGEMWRDQSWKDSLTRSSSLQFTPYALLPGEAVVFSGSSQWHYREAIPAVGGRQFCDLLFFHFIPRGTAELVAPENWPRLFDIPGLHERRPR